MREQVNSLSDEMKKLVVQEYLEGVSSQRALMLKFNLFGIECTFYG